MQPKVNSFWIIVLACLLIVPSVLAQSTSGSIQGTIKDSAGAVVSGAEVLVSQPRTGFSRTVVSNEEGDYIIPSLLPGSYNVQAKRAGFQTKVFENIVLNVSAQMRVDISLEPQGVEEKIVVTSGTAMVETTTPALGQVINNRAVEDLPLNGRNFLQLALLSAGAAPVTINPGSSDVASTNQASINISGGRESSNQFTIDGVFNNAVHFEGLNITLSVDAIQEFKVQRNTFSAEFGQGTAIVNVASKSGNNDFHGTVFEFLRNDALDARQFFDAEVPPFRQNQFGFTFGGPIVRNKLFFFTNYEGLRRTRNNTLLATFPTAAQLSGNFAGGPPIIDPVTRAPFTGNIIPTDRQSALSRRVVPLLPQLSVGGANNFRSAPAQENDFDQFTTRIDYQHGQNDYIFGRYSISKIDIHNPGVIPLTGLIVEDKPQNALIQWTHTFSPTLINDARVGFNRNLQDRLQEGAFDQNILQFQNVINDPINFGLPVINIAGFTGFGTAPTNPEIVGGNTYQYDDNVVWIKGNHSLKFGVDFRNTQFPHQPFLFSRGLFVFQGTASGNPVADFLLGNPLVSFGAGTGPTAFMSLKEISGYAQDDWKINPKLTLNLGLRYQRISAISDRFRGRLGVFDEVSGQIVSGDAVDQQGLANADNNDFGPRVGFAWQPFSSGNTSIRGGYGIYYDVKPVNERNFSLGTELKFQQLVDINQILGLAPGVTWDNLFPAAPSAGSLGILTDDPRARTPYVHQYSLSFQRELPKNLVAEVAYVGSSGHKLNRRIDINQARLPAFPTEPLPVRRPYPNFGSIVMSKNIAVSNYNALQLKLEKRYSSNFYVLAAYTYSKSHDTSSLAGDTTSGNAGTPQNSHDEKAEYGPSAFDQRHRFVLSYIYQLPFGRGQTYLGNVSKLADAFVGGWQIQGITTFASGNPFSVQVVGVDRTNTGVFGGGSQRANQVSSDITVSNPTVQRWFNTAAFQVAPVNTFGNSGRNILVGPGTNNFDFSILKDFHFTEDMKLQFRTEIFNIFNHAQFLQPVTDPTSLAFGQITAARPAREIQFGLKFIF
jgi:Carboxypeptidase regulatory-like domain/TonB dependent receptor-like, beta-barrel